MDTFTLILGIAILVVGTISLLLAGWHQFAYTQTKDASNDFYSKHRKGAKKYFLMGIIAVVLGILLLVVRAL